ncbi:YjzD family protein [Salirhabdus sp. Marseille-P4669]|uniref:YjzD family protein n=1 Tax=Salirhabdus sp. Marseille-P4669 TaxID=2042310 RepID=UPI000C7BB845|nr:YjzD family protein [Salirhabdus sp. Marseille-P4669]
MRYIFTLFWSLLISSMVVYVIGNMSGTPFNITNAVVLAVVFTFVVIVLGDGLLKDEEAH